MQVVDLLVDGFESAVDVVFEVVEGAEPVVKLGGLVEEFEFPGQDSLLGFGHETVLLEFEEEVELHAGLEFAFVLEEVDVVDHLVLAVPHGCDHEVQQHQRHRQHNPDLHALLEHPLGLHRARLADPLLYRSVLGQTLHHRQSEQVHEGGLGPAGQGARGAAVQPK